MAVLLAVVVSFAVRREDSEHALVLLALFGLVTAASGNLLVVILAVFTSSFLYQVWTNFRGPAPGAAEAR